MDCIKGFDFLIGTLVREVRWRMDVKEAYRKLFPCQTFCVNGPMNCKKNRTRQFQECSIQFRPVISIHKLSTSASSRGLPLFLAWFPRTWLQSRPYTHSSSFPRTLVRSGNSSLIEQLANLFISRLKSPDVPSIRPEVEEGVSCSCPMASAAMWLVLVMNSFKMYRKSAATDT